MRSRNPSGGAGTGTTPPTPTSGALPLKIRSADPRGPFRDRAHTVSGPSPRRIASSHMPPEHSTGVLRGSDFLKHQVCLSPFS